jgi:hypothetical protein
MFAQHIETLRRPEFEGQAANIHHPAWWSDSE